MGWAVAHRCTIFLNRRHRYINFNALIVRSLNLLTQLLLLFFRIDHLAGDQGLK